MNLSRALSAPFEDREWLVKVGLGGLWGLLLPLMPSQFGATLAYIRSVADGDETLPSWDDFGHKWVQGLLVMIGLFIYNLPAFVLSGIQTLIAFGSAMAYDAGVVGASLAVACLLSVLSFTWMILASVIYGAGMVNFAMTGRFGSMFAFGEIFGRIRSGTGYFKAWGFCLLIYIAAGLIAGILLALFVGYLLMFWVTFLAYIMAGHVFGQWARTAYGVTPAAQGSPAPPASPTPPAAPVAPAPPAPPAPSASPAAPVAPAPSAPPAPPETP